jgi:hypothetical protein
MTDPAVSVSFAVRGNVSLSQCHMYRLRRIVPSATSSYFHNIPFAVYEVAQLVEALRYKPEGLEFDSRGVSLEFFIDNPSGRTMALESIQPVTPHSCAYIISGSLNLLEPSGPVRACTGIGLPFLLCTKYT